MKLLTRTLITCLIGFWGLGLYTTRADARTTSQNINRIQGVSLKKYGKQEHLVLQGTQKPTYTTFALDDPLRLVVDLQHADLQALKGPFSYSQSLVQIINLRQYTSPNQSIGRLVILLQPDTRWSIQVREHTLVIVFQRNQSPEGQQTTTPANPTPSAAPTQPDSSTNSAPEDNKSENKSEDSSSTNTGESVQPTSPAPVRTESPSLPSRIHHVKLEGESSVVFRSGLQHSSSNESPAQTLLALSLRTRQLTLYTNGTIPQYELLHLRNPSRMVVDLYQIRGYSRTLRRQARQIRCKTSPFRRVRLGRHFNKLRLVFDLCQPHTQGIQFRTQAQARGLKIHLNSLQRSSQSRQEVHAQAPKLAAIQQHPKSTSAQEPTPYDTGSAQVTNVGYGETSNTSSLWVRIQGKTPQIRRQEMGLITMLDLWPARLSSQVKNTLDTSSFKGTIEQIDVFPRGDGVRITLRLKQATDFRMQHKGDLLRLSAEIPSQESQPTQTSRATTSSSKHLAASENYQISYHPRRVGQAGGAAGGFGGDNLSAGDLAILSRSNQRQRYRGRRISIFFHKVEIHNLLRLFAEISGLNIITSNKVQGSVTLRLRNVPWDQALHLVLRTLKLGMEREGNIIRIAPLSEMRQEEQERSRLQQIKLLAQAQKIRLIPVNYATAQDMATQVRTVLSPRGKVNVDNRTNVLIVKDYVPFLIRAEGLVRSLDTQTPQVLIETRIVEANINFDQQFGIQWGGHLLFSPLTGNGTGLQFPNPIGIRGSVPNTGGTNTGDFGTPNYIINFPATVASGRGTALSFLFGSLTGAASLNMRLSAAESTGHVKVISAPKIITLHKMAASIQQGLQIPFTSASAAGTNVQFITASLSLNVSPQVTTDGSIFLTMNITNNQPDFSRGGSAGPAISTKTAQTKMLIKDGETMVIGGVYSRRTGTSQSRIPFLSQIPILGLLFKNYTYNDDRAELLIFVTPRIINRAQTLGGRQGS